MARWKEEWGDEGEWGDVWRSGPPELLISRELCREGASSGGRRRKLPPLWELTRNSVSQYICFTNKHGERRPLDPAGDVISSENTV